MTEDEAKTKWCPMARVGSTSSGNGSLNRDYLFGPPASAMCIGSDCMMWRYTNEVTGRGYCGLAGTP